MVSFVVMGPGDGNLACWGDSEGVLFGNVLLDGTRTNFGETGQLCDLG